MLSSAQVIGVLVLQAVVLAGAGVLVASARVRLRRSGAPARRLDLIERRLDRLDEALGQFERTLARPEPIPPSQGVAVSRLLAGVRVDRPPPASSPSGPSARFADGTHPAPSPRLRGEGESVQAPADRADEPLRPTGPGSRAIGPTLIAVPDLSGPAPAVASQAEAARRASTTDDLSRRFARIWELADRGAPADRIAAQTGQPIGQVELVLNLRRRLLDDPAVEVPA